MRYYRLVAGFLPFLFFSSCYEEDLPSEEPFETPESRTNLKLLSNHYMVDENLGLLVFNGTNTEIDSLMEIGGDTIQVVTTDLNWVLGKSYEVKLKGKSYAAYRTSLPIIVIGSNGNEIVDEPKVLGNFKIIEDDKIKDSTNIGIELRGVASQKFPKKSYSIEMWKDEVGNDTDSRKLLDMRKDDDWILDGLWNEPLRIRDYVAWELWLQFGRYPYSNKEDITLGIKREYVELFLNGNYRGLYYLGEKVDRKQLQLQEFDTEPRGELYKGAIWAAGTRFRDNLDPYQENVLFWSGYEVHYPDTNIQADFRGLYDLVDLTLNSSDEVFKEEVFKIVSLENMVDYFIFLNLIHAPDNTGRNLYTAKYDKDAPYFYVPWDMDATFGNDTKGERRASTERILLNGLLERMLISEEFVEELNTRWNSLKFNVLSTSSILSRFDNLLSKLQNTDVYNRENLSAELPFDNRKEDEIEFINSFVEKQWLFLDDFITSL